MSAQRGQASVEWVGLVLAAALALGALGAIAGRVDGRPLGAALAHRISGRPGRPGPVDRPPPVRVGAAAPLAPVRGRRLRQLLRRGARRGVGANGLACFLRRSTERGDENRIGDDIADALNCLNPVDGWTGELGGRGD